MKKSLIHKRLVIPADDAKVLQFYENQTHPSTAIRLLIHAYVDAFGDVDVISSGVHHRLIELQQREEKIS